LQFTVVNTTADDADRFAPRLAGRPNEFDRYYRDVHTPLVRRIPGVRTIRYGRALRTSDAGRAPYYLVSDVYFDDANALEAARATPEMAAALADVPNFASGGVTIMLCEYEDVAPADPPER
jgi:uncharacterized protein (TIGR02118 family)